MLRQSPYAEDNEYFEYHGNTVIERVRKQPGDTVLRDWILFDSVEEAADYFNENSYAKEL